MCVAVSCPCHLSHGPRSQHNQSTQRMEVQDDERAGTVQHNTTHILHTSTTHCLPLHTHVPFSLPLYTISPPLPIHTSHTVSSSYLQGQTHNETIQQCCKYNNAPWRSWCQSSHTNWKTIVGLGQQHHKCLQVIGGGTVCRLSARCA